MSTRCPLSVDAEFDMATERQCASYSPRGTMKVFEIRVVRVVHITAVHAPISSCNLNHRQLSLHLVFSDFFAV